MTRLFLIRDNGRSFYYATAQAARVHFEAAVLAGHNVEEHCLLG